MPSSSDILARFLSSHTGFAYAFMRVVIGLLFAFHGFQILFGVLTDYSVEPWTQVWIGKIIELVTGLLVAVGLFTTWAAFLASGTMAVAYIQFHWKFQFDAQLLPAINQGEPALMFSVIFLYIACRGSGREAEGALG